MENNPLKYVDPSGHEIKFGTTEFGKVAHNLVEALFLLSHPKGTARKEVFIYDLYTGQNGIADMVLFPMDKGARAEIFELKPGSYANQKTKYYASGKNQLQSYVDAATNSERNESQFPAGAKKGHFGIRMVFIFLLQTQGKQLSCLRITMIPQV